MKESHEKVAARLIERAEEVVTKVVDQGSWPHLDLEGAEVSHVELVTEFRRTGVGAKHWRVIIRGIPSDEERFKARVRDALRHEFHEAHPLEIHTEL